MIENGIQHSKTLKFLGQAGYRLYIRRESIWLRTLNISQ